MKEIVAVIRVTMMNKTKEALEKVGVPAFFACEALGRGKGLPAGSGSPADGPLEATLRDKESKLEAGRLFAKRLLTVVVPDDKKDAVVRTIIGVNKTGHPGDGKVFVIDMNDSLRVRTGESGDSAII